jgi:hypothetical protein
LLIAEIETNLCVAGSWPVAFSLSLDDVEAWLSED